MQRDQREDPHPRPTPLRRAAGPIRGTRILYVDDEPSLRKAIDRMLQAAGATSLLAGTHDQAVRFVASDPALALAIVDFHMPDGPVDALLRRLRSANAGLPLIGTSGADRRREFCDCGVTQFLAKPWQLADLVQAAALMLPPVLQFPAAVPLDSRMGARPSLSTPEAQRGRFS